MKNARWRTIIVLGVVTLGLTVFFSSVAPGKTVLKLANVIPPTSEKNLSCLKFSEIVANKTNGEVQVQVFPASQLGNERDLSIGVVMGTLDLFWGDASTFADYVEEFNIFNSPLLFKNDKHWKAVVESPLFDELAEKLLRKARVRIIGKFPMDFRYILTREKPVYTPDDLEGMKIRVPDIPIWVAGMKGLGAAATPISYAEVYMALQQGVIDGMENPLGLMRSMKFYEVTKYLTLLGWNNAVNVLVINEGVFERLSAEHQRAVLEGGKAAGEYLLDLLPKNRAENLEFMKKQGMIIIEPKKMDEWAEQVKNFPEETADMWGGDPNLYSKIRNYPY